MRALRVAMVVCTQLIGVGCRDVYVEDGAGSGGASSSDAASSHASSTHVTSSQAMSSSTGGISFDPIAFSGVLIALRTQGALAGAEICVLDHPEAACTTSQDDGSFSISIPSDAETGVTIVESGLAKLILPLTTAHTDLPQWLIAVPTESTLAAFYGAAGVTYPDESEGFLTAFASMGNTQSGKPGVVVSLAPPADGAALYADPSGSYGPGLTATTAGAAARFVTSPAEVEVDLDDPDGSCTANFGGWLATRLSGARVPLRAGFMTYVGFACP